jgi:site-specific recombinase XerD
MTDIVPRIPLSQIGQIANEIARKNVLSRYKDTKSAETLRRHKTDITLFEKYLASAQHVTSGMIDDLRLWEGMSYGIVAGFQQWQLQQGYSIGSINVRMATVKSYCDLASQAGYITSEEIATIRGIRGYNRKGGRNIDEKRFEQR